MAAKLYEYSHDSGYPNNGIRQLWFHCPGCGNDHAFTIGVKKKPEDPRWEWNGSFDAPVFSPSLLCNKDTPPSRCHSFVGGINGNQPGKIQFLSDCWHALKDQTVDLPDYE